MIFHVPESERPRERCLQKGAHSLSLRECLALLIHSGPRGVGCLGVASTLLERPGQGMNEVDQERAFFTAMESAGFAHLQAIPGLGPAARARLLASLEIGRRYLAHRLRSEEFQTRNPDRVQSARRLEGMARSAVIKIDDSLRLAAQEWIGFVPVYLSQELGAFHLVERGVRTHVNFDPAELFARLLALRPSGFFLFHNHPQGSLDPSEADHDLTNRVAHISAALGVRLLAHGIITATSLAWVPCASSESLFFK